MCNVQVVVSRIILIIRQLCGQSDVFAVHLLLMAVNWGVKTNQVLLSHIPYERESQQCVFGQISDFTIFLFYFFSTKILSC